MGMDSPKGKPAPPELRSKVITAVQSPIGLLALVVLIIEGIIAALTFKLTGVQAFYAVVLMFVIMVLVLVIVWRHVERGGGLTGAGQSANNTPSTKAPAAVSPRFEVFVAAAMAAFNDPVAYDKARSDTLRVVATLRKKLGGAVFYAGEELKASTEFDKIAAVATEDLNKVAASRYFLLLYLDPIPSSTLAETGYALAYRIPSIYCCRKTGELPYLLRQAVLDKNLPVTSMEITGVDDLIKEIEKQGAAMFPTGD